MNNFHGIFNPQIIGDFNKYKNCTKLYILLDLPVYTAEKEKQLLCKHFKEWYDIYTQNTKYGSNWFHQMMLNAKQIHVGEYAGWFFMLLPLNGIFNDNIKDRLSSIIFSSKSMNEDNAFVFDNGGINNDNNLRNCIKKVEYIQCDDLPIASQNQAGSRINSFVCTHWCLKNAVIPFPWYQNQTTIVALLQTLKCVTIFGSYRCMCINHDYNKFAQYVGLSCVETIKLIDIDYVSLKCNDNYKLLPYLFESNKIKNVVLHFNVYKMNHNQFASNFNHLMKQITSIMNREWFANIINLAVFLEDQVGHIDAYGFLLQSLGYLFNVIIGNHLNILGLASFHLGFKIRKCYKDIDDNVAACETMDIVKLLDTKMLKETQKQWIEIISNNSKSCVDIT